MDFSEFNDAVTPLLAAVRHTLRTELTSVWLPIQFGLIGLAAVIALGIAAVIRNRTDIVSLTMGWPPVLRMIVRTVLTYMTPIAFVLVLLMIRTLLRADVAQPRTYLMGVAISLTTAWVVINVAAGVIQNRFVNRVVTVSAWTIAALSILRLLDPVAASLDSTAMSINVGGLRFTPLLLLKTTALLLITLWAANAAGNFLQKRVETFTDLTPSIQVLISKLIRIALVTLAVILVLSSMGIDLSVLALFSGAVGVGLGFGLQKIVSNLVSGIILLADKSIKPGDVITVGEQFGWVTTMGARYTAVNTRDGREYLVPNEDFITQKVINWSYSTNEILVEFKFGVSYDSDPHRVREIALAATNGVPRVLDNPPAVCHLIAFGDSSLDFCLRFWINDPSNGLTNVRGTVMLKLWDAFKREGIEIPYPVRDVRLSQPAVAAASGKKTKAAKT